MKLNYCSRCSCSRWTNRRKSDLSAIFNWTEQCTVFHVSDRSDVDTWAKAFVRFQEGCSVLLQALQPSRLGGSGVLLGTREGQRSFCDCSERSLSLTDPTFLCGSMFYLAWSHSGSSLGLFCRFFWEQSQCFSSLYRSSTRPWLYQALEGSAALLEFSL